MWPSGKKHHSHVKLFGDLNGEGSGVSRPKDGSKPIFVTQSSMPDFDEYIGHLRDIFESKWLTNMGPKHQDLEHKLTQYLGVPHISLMSNGHMALELTLQAFDLPRGGEIITTPFTFISTTHAIVRNGFEPVFADVDPDTCCITAVTIEALITSKTVAIMPVHVYGNICDVEGIQAVADKYGLPVIYDAAHAFGATVDDVGVGNYGDASVFSFHATKIFNTIEGGAVTFTEERFVKPLYNLKNFGIRNAIYVEAVGSNAKMNEFQAAMGLANLTHIEQDIQKRKELNDLYAERLGGIEGITLLTETASRKEVGRNYAYMPVHFDKEVLGISRDDIEEALIERNIYPRKYFYPLTNDAQCYIGRFSSDGTNGSKPTPVAKYLSDGVLTLPIYPDLDAKHVNLICDVIQSRVLTKVAV
jgi:dTDP-4-amino-4,6-dideoxygalactose transaminase